VGSNAALAQRWFREVWASGGEATVDELMAADGRGWLEGGAVSGPSEFKIARSRLLGGFPDLAVTVDDLIEQGDKVAVRWSAKATHSGAGLGFAATHLPVSFHGMTWLEFREGKIIHGWDSWNLGALVQTLTAAAAAR
jgi:predicted ester cyclase